MSKFPDFAKLPFDALPAQTLQTGEPWQTPEGIAVQWTRMGEGNIDIASWVRRYRELCPGRALSMEIIVTGPRNRSEERRVGKEC